MKHQNGFTLVELAIVLMIIGLLVGGILRGQELMENARVSSSIQQVKAYTGAIHTFRDEYAAIPGDMAQALNRIPNCTATNFCDNGDGDGIVGTPIRTANFNTDGNNQTGVTKPKLETTLFWKHLSMAHLITGVNNTANPASASWGTTHPIAKIGGGFTVMYSAESGDFGIGNILRLQISPSSSGSQGNMAISPIKARMIDQKMDDGMPNSGSVQADYDATKCDLGGVYANSEEKDCVMYFNLD